MDSIKPDYYKGKDGKDLFDRFEDGLMPIEKVKGFYQGNIVKYVTRYSEKNGVEDLKKARTYLDRLIKLVEKPEYKMLRNLFRSAGVSTAESMGNTKDDDMKYTVQVFSREDCFLVVNTQNGLCRLGSTGEYNHVKCFFTQSELDQLKQRNDIAVDWNKAIIRQVEE